MTWVFALVDARDASLVGSKAANLGVMARDLGLPVPPGFAISTEACRAYLAGGWPDGLDDEIRARMAAIETAIGRRFGDAADPLLVSVRSGAPVSMPGMMDTILNLGLTPDDDRSVRRRVPCRGSRRCSARPSAPRSPTTRGRSSGRRSRRSSVRGTATGRGRTARRRGSRTTSARGSSSRRWSSATAARIRGPGVLFTRNPATGERALYGDVMFDAQGEDVVAGTHATEPISVLDERMPAVAGELRDHADRLERHYADMCDIEFTIEDGRLWLLQVRVGKRSPQAALRIAVDMAEDDAFPLSRADAVERVRPLLADPPVRATSRSSILRPLITGPACLAGDRQRRDRHDARSRRRGRRGRAPRHPRPLGDLARRRPRHGQGGRDPDRERRSRQPRRGRGARLGHPRGGRRVRGAGRRSLGGARRSAVPGRRHDHDRRWLRRGVRGRDPRHDRARTRGRHAARMGPRARHHDRRPNPSPRPRSAATRSASVDSVIRAPRDQGLRHDPGRRRRRAVVARAGPAVARRPGGRRARGVGRRRLPAHRQRQGPRGGARRGGGRGMGSRARQRRARCVRRPRPADEGGRDGLAAQGAGRRQRPRRPGVRPRRPRPAGRAPRAMPRRSSMGTTTGSAALRPTGSGSPARSTRPSTGTAASWRHRGWTAITASGSSSTRT